MIIREHNELKHESLYYLSFLHLTHLQQHSIMSDTSTSGEDEHLHVRIRPECGACGYRFTPRQRIITRTYYA